MHMTLMASPLPDPEGWGRVATKIRSVYSPPLKAEATWLKYRQALDLLVRHSPEGPHAVDESTISGIIHELNDRKCRLTTINSILRVERSICNYLVKRKYLDVSPFAGVQLMMRVPRGYVDKKAFRPEQMARVLDQADREFAESTKENHFRTGRLRALLYLLAYTGMRAREALYTRCQDIHVERRVVEITEADRRQKTLFAAAPVPLPEEAAQVLHEWKCEQTKRKRKYFITCVTKDSPWDSGLEEYRPCGQLKALGERAGVEGMTLASLRHTFTTNAKLSWGLNREETKQILRHTSEDTQEHYTHDDIDHLVDRVKGFTYRPRSRDREMPQERKEDAGES